MRSKTLKKEKRKSAGDATLTLRQYPAIHTNYNVSNCTILTTRICLIDLVIWWQLIEQVTFWTTFSMQPKAEMVPKECGFNQSQTV